MWRYLLLILLLFCPAFLAAQTTVTAPDCTLSGVQNAWNSNVNASTTLFVIPACSAASGQGGWGGTVTFNVPAGNTNITIQGSTTCSGNGTSGVTCTDGTVIIDNYSAQSVPLLQINTQGASTFVRVTGMTFQGGTVAANSQKSAFIQIAGGTQNLRVDHSHFNTTTYTAANQGSSQSNAVRVISQIYGVVDHCLFDSLSGNQGNQVDHQPYNWGGSNFGDGAWADTTSFGTNKFLFVEDNTDNNGAINNAQTGGRMVIRHNTLNGATNGAIQTHALGQGEQRERAGRAMEVYNNIENGISSNPFFYCIWVGSGPWMIYNNTCVNYQNFIDFVSVRVDTSHSQNAPPGGWGWCGTLLQPNGASNWDQNLDSSGYACMDQLGRGQGDALNGQDFPNALNSATGTVAWPRQKLEPVYEWLNTFTAAPGYTGRGPNVTYQGTPGIQEGRDYFIGMHGQTCNPTCNTPGPGTGATGVGAGTLAQRPATCTPNGTAYPTGNTPGVGYWATDTNTLYVCTSASVWTSYYTPFQYPHPLVTGGGGGCTGICLQQSNSIDAGTVTTTSLAFNVVTSPGNFIAVVARAGTNPATITVNDSNGNAYASATQFVQTTDGHTDAIVYAQNIRGGADTVTVSLAAAATLRVMILEFSGVATSNALDVTASAQGSSTAPNSNSATTTTAKELLLGAISTANSNSYTPGTGYTIILNQSNKLATLYQQQTSAGPASATATLSASDNWAAGLATFRPLGGGPPPPPNPPSSLLASASGTTVNLSWTASSPAPTGYTVYRGTTSGGPYNTLVATGITGTTYPNTGLAAGTYFYVVTAFNGGIINSISGNGSTATVTCNAACTFPANSSVVIAGNSQSVYNGTFTVNAPQPTASTFTFASTSTSTGTGGAAWISTSESARSNQASATVGGTLTLSFSPTSLTFASTVVGQSTPSQAITTTNTSGVGNNVTISNVALTGTNPSDFSLTTNCVITLVSGATCTTNVTFTPTAAGTRTANVQYTDTATGNPQTVPLTGTGATGVPAVTLTPAALIFGSQLTSTSSVAVPIILKNSGTGTLSISSIAMSSGTNFSQTNTCGSTLGVGLTCTINVTFTPTVTGTLLDSVVITDNASGSPHNAGVSGVGITSKCSLTNLFTLSGMATVCGP